MNDEPVKNSGMFSTSYELLPDGRLRFVVATLDDGEVFVMDLDHEEALNNLQAFAATLGLVVTRPLTTSRREQP